VYNLLDIVVKVKVHDEIGSADDSKCNVLKTDTKSFVKPGICAGRFEKVFRNVPQNIFY